ncbi:Ku protein [Rhodoplanes roseus]|uniref:Non-homologous end joining protein Ku n=1 Tax=Rhodoplanes roseus TaxID=29409 RepID=A0A327KVL3_9BRAD|nr:Ku protein [Rhodoplanes roseus]RAI42930.1 Ku protein [Rhodoplanes roseus]
MAPRPNWKGYLKLSLVSCPVALYPATSAGERVAFRQINRATGNRLKQQLVDAVTGDPVAAADKARGFEVERDRFILVDDDEIDALQVESTRTIEIDAFVPRDQIDVRYLEAPYYVVPNDKVGQEAFAVIREAMRGKNMVALGRVVLSRRERVIALEAFGKGLRGVLLRYPYEVRGEEPYFEDIPEVQVPKEMLSLAEHILDSKATDFDPAGFHDRYEEALVELLQKKQAGRPSAPATAASTPATVINLMDALKRSIVAETGTGSAPAETKPGRTKKAKRPTGQREMLLPIPGKGAAKPSVAEPARPRTRGRQAS